MIERLTDREYRPDIHVSDIVGCAKKAAWSKKAPQPEYVHSMIYATMGTAMHAHLEEEDEHGAVSELEVAYKDVLGRADRYYEDGRLVDFKTSRWITPSKLPYGSHSLQLNVYAHMLRKTGKPVTSLAVQYIDLSGPTKCRKCRLPLEVTPSGLACPKCGNQPKNAHLGAMLVEVPIMPEREIERVFEERRRIIRDALDNNHLPEGEPSWLCHYCSFHEICEDAL